MATNKNRINSYVGDEEYRAFLAFCQDWGCSQSKGVEIMIRQFLIDDVPHVTSNALLYATGNVLSNVNSVTEDELTELRERLGKLESNVPGNVNSVTEDEVKDAIADSIDPLMVKLEALSNRVKSLESEIGEKSHVPIDVDSSPLEDGEGITAKTLAPIFDTPSEDSPLESPDLPSPSEGISQTELAKMLGINTSTITKWKQKLEEGTITSTISNKSSYQKFRRWFSREVEGKVLWFKRTDIPVV